MHVTVFGSGYVGLVAGACFAETGNDVVCADIDARKVERLRANDLPIYEPGLEPIVRRNQAEGRLRFTTDLAAAVRHGEVLFIAVGTPPGENGSADLQHVLDVARTIGEAMDAPKIVATKSTVPVGTAEKVRQAIAACTGLPFSIVANPEFLKEGAAVDDFMKPNRVIVGLSDGDQRARDVMGQLYSPFTRRQDRIFFMDLPSAEVTKYAANAMLASRISFMNQLASLCENVGADVTRVRQGIGSDDRIGNAFLFPGPGYGGSCFPKDVKALIRTMHERGLDADLLEAVEAVNERQKRLLPARLRSLLGDVRGKTVAVWGLAFKAETDDMRESSSIPLIEDLLAAGAKVQAHDPQAAETAHAVFGDHITYARDPYAAAEGADALVIVTEWLVYRNPDFPRLHGLLRRPLIVDGRNLYDPARVAAEGFAYHSIGRPPR